MLGQGERLDRMAHMSSQLSMESKKYAAKSKQIYIQALVQKYTPVAVVLVLVVVFWYIRKLFR